MADITHADLPSPRQPLDPEQVKALLEPYVSGNDDIVVHAGDVFHSWSE